MTNLEQDQTTTTDIRHIRKELVATIHEVAKALAKRGRSPTVLIDVAKDLDREARALRHLAS